MPADQHDKIYSLLLDAQKQIGSISRETGEQTKMLAALNDKVATQNGRVTKSEMYISELKEWRKYILGGFAVISLLGVYLINAFTKDIVKQTSEEVISLLEEKYNLKILNE